MYKANTFSHGDLVLLIDPKKRQYIIHLDSKGVFHSVNGAISHSEILGEIFGTRKNIGNKTYIFMGKRISKESGTAARAHTNK